MEEEISRPDILNLLSDYNSESSLLSAQLFSTKDPMFPTTFLAVADDLNAKYLGLSQLQIILPKLDSIYEQSPLLDLGRQANSAIFGLTTLPNIELLSTSIQPETFEWLKQINPVSSLLTPVAETADCLTSGLSFPGDNLSKLSEFVIQSSLGKIAEMSLLSENIFAGFDPSDLGKNIGMALGEKTKIGASLFEMTDSYAHLFKEFQIQPDQLVDLGPLIIRGASVEYFNEANLCGLLSVEQHGAVRGELVQSEIAEENELSLQKKLSQVDSRLIRLWEGAKQTIKSDNPDKARHFSISIRELLTHVLHKLAPNEEIRRWTSEEEYFHEGNPTRKARLMYICRKISAEPFERFFEKDVAATLEFMDLFQDGTHAVQPSMTDKHLQAFKARAEATIKYILEVAFN